MKEKHLQLERLVFFSDAVVAIAITLLALDIKIEHTASGHLQFSDVFHEWHTFGAFLLSFFNIANFWKAHHSFFVYINKIDDKVLWFNIGWLLFIVLLPFCTSLVSNFFTDTASVFLYSLNLFFISIFQNNIWDYSSDKKFLNQELIETTLDSRIRLFCNLDMLNSLLGVVVSVFSPLIAFIILFTKLPTFVIIGIYIRRQKGLKGGTSRKGNNKND